MTRGEMMKFDFYYGEESEQYSFYSVPKMFFTCERFAGLSAMSKLLYGFLLDRMSLSRKRNWIDDKNRAYIKYSLNAITKDMGVSKNSVIKYMRELQEFGLIMKYPNEGMEDIIYVMDYSRVKQGDTYSSDDKQNDNVLYLDSQSSVAAYKADTGHPDNAPPGFNTAIALSNINNTKKIQDNIASLKCDIAYLHNCTKGTIQEQTQKVILSIICANLLINIVFFILTFVLKG